MDATPVSDDGDASVINFREDMSVGVADTPEKPGKAIETSHPGVFPAVGAVTFVKRKNRFVLSRQSRFRNDLLGGVGFLEFGNACDFAANVWNQVPIPVYALVLMVGGGTVALVLSIFAFIDARHSWHNVRVLRKQRQNLRDEKVKRSTDSQRDAVVRDLDALLDLNFRELGSELINRIVMDILLGYGAVTIGIGTLMALGGANYSLWLASNLLTGYIGNAPLAVYSLVNCAWEVYVWKKAQRHKVVVMNTLRGSPATILAKQRFRNVQIYSVLNGVTSLLGGFGSMVTATMWWGYVVLIPVIISSILCNFWWRRKVGYDRPFIINAPGMGEESLVREIELVATAQQTIKESPLAALGKLVSDPNSIASVVEFMLANDLFEDFCRSLLGDANLSADLFDLRSAELKIDPSHLLVTSKECDSSILEAAEACISEVGLRHFRYRGNYILEVLGSYLDALRSTTQY